MKRLTLAMPLSGLHSSSSRMTSIFLPLMPPDGVDRLELILGHLAVLEAVLHDHAQRDADADHAVLGLRRAPR